MQKRFQSFVFLLIATVTGSLAIAGCGTDPIDSIMTFDVGDSLQFSLEPGISLNQDTSWTFNFNVGAMVDSNRSACSLVRSAKVSRIALFSSAGYPLSNLAKASLFVSSAHFPETMVGTTTSFLGENASGDILPSLVQIAQAVADSIVTFRLQLAAGTAPTASDTLWFKPTISILAEPQ